MPGGCVGARFASDLELRLLQHQGLSDQHPERLAGPDRNGTLEDRPPSQHWRRSSHTRKIGGRDEGEHPGLGRKASAYSVRALDRDG